MALTAEELWTSQRAPLLWIAVPLVAGIWLAGELSPLAHWPWLLAGVSFGSVALALILRGSCSRITVWLIGAAFLFAAAGWGALRLPVEPVAWKTYPPREARLDLRITSLFAAREAEDRISGLGTVTATDPHLAELAGQRVAFSLRLENGPPPVLGDTLKTVGTLRHHEAGNEAPDPFDAYLTSQGVYLKLRGGRAENVTEGTTLGRLLQSLLDRMEGALREGSEQHPALADTVVAMLLGESGALAPGQKEAYMQTGTMHLFSISGLHIAVIAGAFLFLARGLRLRDRPAALLTLACLLAYVLATGARPSALRAFLMVLCHQGAHLCGRRPAPFSALVAAALLTLAWDPLQLWDAGFQLSYAVVFALLLYGAPLSQHLISRVRFFTLLPKADWRWHHKLAEWLARTAASSLAISLAATLFSAPATLALFGLWSPGALLMNLLLIPLAGLVLVAGLIALPLGLGGFGAGASLFNHASWALASLMDVIARAGAQLPGMWIRPAEPVGGGEAALVTTMLFAGVLIAPPGHRSGWFWWTPPLLLALWMGLR